jgi:hypothetical protein
MTQRTLADSLSLMEGLTRAYRGFRYRSDSLGLSENLVPSLKFTVNVTDYLTLLESIARNSVFTRNLNDSLSLIEELLQVVGYNLGYIRLVPGFDQVFYPNLDAQLVVYPDQALNLLETYCFELVPGTEAVVASLPDWHYYVNRSLYGAGTYGVNEYSTDDVYFRKVQSRKFKPTKTK